MRFLFFAITILHTCIVMGQVTFEPLQQRSNIDFERKIYEHNIIHHPSIQQWVHTYSDDSLKALDEDRWSRKEYQSWIGRKVFVEDFIEVDTANFKLRINPMFNLQLGQDVDDTSGNRLSTNTRGLSIEASLGNKFGFFTSFWENQSFFPTYLNEYVSEVGTVPGQGRVKPFKETGFDYARASAVMYYKPKSWLYFQAGHGKNFYGNGYRSLLLSDFAFNYPYLKVGLSMFKGKLLYQPSFAALQQLQRLPATGATEAQFVRKAGTFHILNYQPHKRVELGFFEAGIWQNWDTNGTVQIPANYYVPIPLLNSSVNSLESEQYKGIVGFNARVTPLEKLVLYAQSIIGQHQEAKFGSQIGAKWFDAFTLPDLFLQVEYNSLDDGLYNHRNSSLNYDHYSEGLGNYSTNGLEELVLRLNYSFRNLFVSLKYNEQNRSREQVNTFGNVKIITTPRVNIQLLNAELGYLFNKSNNFMLLLGVQNRVENSVATAGNSQWVYLAIRTELQNLYFDF